MSRDGLLPKVFGKIHPKFKTPSFSTIITGVLVGIPALFMDQAYVTDLTAIGTLFAFSLVCGGVLMLDERKVESKFKVPYLNAKYISPLIFIATIVWLFVESPETITIWKNEILTGEKWADVLLKVLFFIFWAWLSVLSFKKNLSLIPVAGVLINLFLMTELGGANWLRFIIWCLIGFGIYFGYGYRKSKLALQQ